MKENLNNQNKEETEGTYEQFDTDETFPQDKKNKNLFSPKKIYKIYINNLLSSLSYSFSIYFNSR